MSIFWHFMNCNWSSLLSVHHIIINRCQSISGHRYPMPYLGRWVNIVGQRWGISPEGGKPFSSWHICRTILSVRPSIHLSIQQGRRGGMDVCMHGQTEWSCIYVSRWEGFAPFRADAQNNKFGLFWGGGLALGALNIAKHIIFGL